MTRSTGEQVPRLNAGRAAPSDARKVTLKADAYPVPDTDARIRSRLEISAAEMVINPQRGVVAARGQRPLNVG
ncbi:MAG: hypothetical protein DLM66_01485 [Candidatus Dormiibacter spiritus]|nr:MAG: hypothetical protein DLM66_01485 [Candidatus Dormibacteraeota bacterium]